MDGPRRQLRRGSPPNSREIYLGRRLQASAIGARGGGWFGHAGRRLEESQRDCVEQGYLLVPAGLQSLGVKDAASALAAFVQAAKIGDGYANVAKPAASMGWPIMNSGGRPSAIGSGPVTS